MAGKNTPSKVYIRFSVLNRLLHWAVMVGFIGLAVTGFSLKFGSQWWAQAVVFLLGGPERLGTWHRFWAVITYGSVIVHLGWLVYFKTLLKGNLTGPQTLFPSTQDANHLVQHIRYFLGRSRPPRFNRFTYFEKIDYWAILVGMNTMGLTGAVLWFPEFFSALIPGYFINLALIIHVYEAIMAVALKFVIHIITTHLRPEVFPLDRSIFSGRTSEDRIQNEHPGEWDNIIGLSNPKPVAVTGVVAPQNDSLPGEKEGRD
jgi:cytochrome b subunit of formate dehydrogenase